MKITFLSDDFPPISFGGAGISTFELALGMKKAGHDVSVITTCRKESEAGEIAYQGITIFSIATDYAPRWRMYRSINNSPAVRSMEILLKKIQPDIVHVNNVHYHLSFRSIAVAKKYARGVVFTGRDTLAVFFGKLSTPQYLESLNPKITIRDHFKSISRRYNPFYYFFTKWYLAQADVRTTVSHALRDAFIVNGVSNVHTVHTGVQLSDWESSDDEKINFRKKYALENKKIVLFSGRLSEGKGSKKILDALYYMVREVPDVVLLVVASMDAHAKAMLTDAEKLGIGSSLVITGWAERDAMRVAYAVSSVVIVPSVYLDPFPRVVIEAMASGVPVIGSRYGGSPEIIQHGVTGYIVDPRSPGEIAEKSIDLLRNPKKAEQFGRAGYERVKKNFNLEDKVKEYISQYENCMKLKLSENHKHQS